ncbi:MAG: peptidoglycan recognition family protein [Peptococcales bacterium]|jgi:N-acetylmuramoyl-L-alanine amidase
MVKWQGIIIHHSASPRGYWQGEEWLPINAQVIKRWHVEERGWSDIGYHYVVLANGIVESGRPLDRIGAHTRAGNRNFSAIGVCLVGNFQYDTVAPEQLEATIRLVNDLRQKYHISLEKIELHSQVPGSNTLCPGRLFPNNKFFKLLNSG